LKWPICNKIFLGSCELKARVYVTFKPSVLDPQGQTIRAALNGLGHKGIEDVRQGKFFEITLQPGEDLDAISHDVLSNPVIEDYRIEILE
jgi:phosphoribosylformylglycinamidine synthase